MATEIDSINFIEWDSKHRQYLIRLAGSAESQEKRLAQMKASEDMYEALKEVAWKLLREQYGVLLGAYPEYGEPDELKIIIKALAKAEGKQ